MPIWILFVWMAVGVIAGITARRMFFSQSVLGSIGDVILGLAGGVIGGYLFSLVGLGNTVGNLIGSLVAAVVLAVVLVWSTKFIAR